VTFGPDDEDAEAEGRLGDASVPQAASNAAARTPLSARLRTIWLLLGLVSSLSH
jgi:hypothetical protein